MSLTALQVTATDIATLEQGVQFMQSMAANQASVAASINTEGSGQSVFTYAASLLGQTTPSLAQIAMADSAILEGGTIQVGTATNPATNTLTFLTTQFLPGQFQAGLKLAPLGINPTLYASEGLGLALADTAGFTAQYGSLTPSQFVTMISTQTGVGASPIQTWVTDWLAFYNGVGAVAVPTGLTALQAAEGATAGDAMGAALLAPASLNLPLTTVISTTTPQTPTQFSPNTVTGQVANALIDNAEGTYTAGVALKSLPAHAPLQGEFQSGPNPPPVTWVSEGPSPGINGQQGPSGNFQLGGLNTDGAIQAIAVNPTNPNIMFVATVNGGIWETTNATAATPHWVPLTDTLPSLSMGALAFDPTDATHQTLIAGIGATSSFSAIHNTLSGVLLTTDGGQKWSQLGTTALAGDNITSVAARGTTLLAAADSTWSGVWGPSGANGLFRSTDNGTKWTNISDGAHGLPNNISVSDLVGDPLNSNVFYAGVTGATGGVFKSTDGGLNWTNISAGIGIIGNTTDKILLAVHDDGTHVAVFATVNNAILGTNPASTLSGVFQSLDGGSFKALDVPDVPSDGTGGNLFGSISADPTNPNIVYVGYGGGEAGGDGYLTRIDASKTAGHQITPLNGGSFGSPHADLRDMQIDANGNLILSSDGGLYSLPTPTVNTGAWKAIGGDIGAFELHDIAYDHISKVIVAGSQDNGTLAQLTPGGTTWNTIEGGDGGDVAIDDVSLAGVNESIRYVSAQNLLSFQRQVYDSANKLVSTTFLADITKLGNDGQFITPLEVNNVDPTLILVGGSKNIYMSSDQGTTLTAIDNAGVNSGSSGATMVYGGYQNGVADPDLIYAASGANVLTKTTAGGGFTSTAPGGGTIVGVTDNPNNWATVFAVTNNQVFESTNAGGTWVPVTQNLTSISGGATFYSIAYVPDAGNDALVLGTSSGVFDAHVSGLGVAAAWSQFGANLPNVIVDNLQYDAHDNVLVAATMGRGAWLVNNATVALGGISAVDIVGIADHVNSHMV